MAGAGRRTFQPGEVLTASNVNSYLMDQSVMRFADSTARGSAIGTAVVAEGMLTYLDDTNFVEFFDSAQWRRLQVDGSQITEGTISGARLPSGSILQVVQSTTTTQTSTTSTTFVNTALTASITPSSTSSKILIVVSAVMEATSSGELWSTIFRGTVTGTNLGAGTSGFGRILFTPVAQTNAFLSISYLDAPATTSSQQYTLAIRRSAGGTVYANANAATSTMTLIEVAA